MDHNVGIKWGNKLVIVVQTKSTDTGCVGRL